jgi:anti-sigma factor RsiW
MSEPLGETTLLLQAALDGELDAAGMLAFERAMAQDADLAAEYQSLLALRIGLQGLPKPRASEALRSRVAALAEAPKVSVLRPKRFAQAPQWLPMGIAACFAFLIGSGITYLAVPQPPSENSSAQMQALLADHVRGLISGQPVDVVSSERHTVKPWFDTHIALSPEVVDLKADGFPLVGGRIDVIGVTPVPTLVFRRNQHIISLSEMPESLAQVPEGKSSLDGFAVLAWRHGHVIYIAISDAMPAELESLKAAFEKATAAQP